MSTSNGGSSWLAQSGLATNILSSVYFTDSQNGWIVGRGGTILHTSTGGMTKSHKSIVNSPNFSIYPNPVKESFTLETRFTILDVCISDGLGRKTPVIQLPENQIDIRNLKSGMYWVKVQTSEGMTVQKLIKE